MDKEIMRQLIIKTDKKNQNNKLKRTIKAYLLFVALYSVLFYWVLEDGIIDAILVSLVISAIHMIISLVVFSRIIDAADKEDASLNKLKEEYYNKYGEYIL